MSRRRSTAAEASVADLPPASNAWADSSTAGTLPPESFGGRHQVSILAEAPAATRGPGDVRPGLRGSGDREAVVRAGGTRGGRGDEALPQTVIFAVHANNQPAS